MAQCNMTPGLLRFKTCPDPRGSDKFRLEQAGSWLSELVENSMDSVSVFSSAFRAWD